MRRGMKNPPRFLKFGSVVFPVFTAKDGRLGFRYKLGEQWRQCLRRSIAKLKADGERIAIAICNNETAAAEVTAEDRRIYISARDALTPLGSSLDAIARDVAEAHHIAPGLSLRDLALFYKRNHIGLTTEAKVTQCTADLLSEINELDLSGRFKRDMKNDLELIDQHFGDRCIADILPEEILACIRQLQVKRKFAWKRRNHIRNAFVYVWNYAKRMGRLPQDRDTAAQRVSPLEEPRTHSPVQVYSPEEMRFWIANIKEQYLPWLLVCGFSLVRSEEVAPDKDSNKDPLRWSDFRWEKKYLRVRRETSKVREPRNVPIPDNLIAWLTNWRDATGLVCAGEQPSKRETSRLTRLAGDKELPYRWKKNALRHTSISARLGLTRDRARVAEEAGTSPGRIRKNYNEGFDEDQANAWYAIMPDYAGNNILPLWQSRSGAK